MAGPGCWSGPGTDVQRLGPGRRWRWGDEKQAYWGLADERRKQMEGICVVIWASLFLAEATLFLMVLFLLALSPCILQLSPIPTTLIWLINSTAEFNSTQGSCGAWCRR